MSDATERGEAMADDVAQRVPARPVLSQPMEVGVTFTCECGRKHVKKFAVGAMVQEVSEAPKVQLAGALPSALKMVRR